MPESPELDHTHGGKARAIWDEPVLADLAGRQHGVVARRQLLRLGMTGRMVEHRILRGRLHPLHRGVYAVGHRHVTARGRWLAAVLAAGAGAVLSHRSAAALWGLRDTAAALIDVTVPHGRAARAGLRLHQIPLADDERTIRDGIPVTSPARTLFDLATVLTPQALERAAAQAEVQRLAGAASLATLLERHAGRTGAPAVRALLASGAMDAGITRSMLEERFLEFLDAQGLPRPQLNRTLAVGRRTIEADCVWPDRRLIVELDSRAVHDTAAAFERDRERDRTLLADGWRTARVTWRHVHRDGPATARDLRRLLAVR